MKPKTKKILKIAGFTVLGIVVALVIFLLAMLIYHKTYKIPPQAEKIENSTGLVKAQGRSL